MIRFRIADCCLFSCRQSGALNNTQGSAPSPVNKDLTTLAAVTNMPQQGSVPRTTAAVHTYSADARHNMSVSFVERKSFIHLLFRFFKREINHLASFSLLFFLSTHCRVLRYSACKG